MTSGLKVGGISAARKYGTKDEAALNLIAEEMKKVRRQFDRIKQDRIEIETQSALVLDYVKVDGENTVWDNSKNTAPLIDMIRGSGNKHTFLLADIHYLLISLAMIGKLFNMLEKALPDAHELVKVRQKYDSVFQEYSDVRGIIEHIYNKLEPGLPNHGGHDGEYYFFGDKRFNVGKKRQDEIEQIHDDIIAAVKAYRDSTQKPRQAVTPPGTQQ